MALSIAIRKRSGAVALESALVLPVFLLLVLMLIVGGIGVFRYQQTACLAREAARFASVRGADYQLEQDTASPTQAQIREQAVLPLAVNMDLDQVDVNVEWVDQANNVVQAWDLAKKYVRTIHPSGVYVNHSVRVTVTYRWTPGVLLEPLTLRSVCEVPMGY